MQSFISTVVKSIIENYNNLTNLKIILPSKRAGVFFKDELKTQVNKISFLPEILSIEEFVNQVSETELLSNIEVLFEFYQVYLKITPKEKVILFDQFINWSSILMQDINEIDRHLINATSFFNYLGDIERIEKWFLKNKGQSNLITETTLTKNHLNFFNSFAKLYNEFYKYLKEQNKAYQGLQYREATHKIENYINSLNDSKIIFVGFNALNKAEEYIIKQILDKKVGEIYFDVDQYFLDQKLPYARFIKTYKTDWNYFNTNKFNNVSNDYIENKNIQVIGVPKNVTLIKEAGNILKSIYNKSINYKRTALVLANENLLMTVLNSLPKEVEQVNITMGYPLKNIDLSNLFLLYFKSHQNKIKLGKNKSYYYKDVIALIKHAGFSNNFKKEILFVDNVINNIILKDNLHFIDEDKIFEIFKNDKLSSLFHLLFETVDTVNQFIENCISLLSLLLKVSTNHLEIEFINRFQNLFHQLLNYQLKYTCIESITSLQIVYKQLLQSENLSFKGEPLSGLQIMGMLETRVLDFETVIITSVNEGYLPSGKTQNSFIPFDVKKEFGLPTYNEKDAIFSYHFYRLIQRAKNVYLLYNTETDDFGSGEQSRFITQLEVFNELFGHHTIQKSIVSPKLKKTKANKLEIYKSTQILDQLDALAKKGFSPTTLTNYIYNPLAFYKQKILKIKSLEEIEETIASNTFGTVIHNVLEELYTPFLNIVLTEKQIALMQKKATETVLKYFKSVFKNGDITQGKNLLVFEIAKHYIKTFLDQEAITIKNGKQLIIRALESDLTTVINIKSINKPITLTGQADRIDELDGVLRIIDYKTGLVKPTNLIIKNWDLIITDYKKYSKSFQVLMYAFMYAKMNKLSFESQQIESGIISFKNLKAGFMKVNKKPISKDDIVKFEDKLKELLTEIYDPNIPFIENENLAY